MTAMPRCLLKATLRTLFDGSLGFTFVFVGVIGCGTGTDRTRVAFTVRDSAGIKIANNVAAEWTVNVRWLVAATPSVSLGVTSGDPNQEFSRVRDALQLADGTIIVADAGVNELRFFDRSGAFLRRVGQTGEGPGEYRSLWWLRGWSGDSLIAYDVALRRFSVLLRDGTYVRSFGVTSTAQAPNPYPVGVLSDGAVLGTIHAPPPRRGTGYARLEIPIYRVRQGLPPDSLGFAIVREQHFEPLGNGFLGVPVPFGRTVYWAIGDDVLLEGDGERYEIRVRGFDGRVRRMIRRSLSESERVVTDEDRSTAFDFLQNRSPQQSFQTAVNNALRKMRIPTTKPAFGRRAWERVPTSEPDRPSLIIDATGHLWILEYTIENTSSGRPWAVFDPDGRFLGTVELPNGFEPFEIGDDHILGWAADELGVIYVQLYELSKPG